MQSSFHMECNNNGCSYRSDEYHRGECEGLILRGVARAAASMDKNIAQHFRVKKNPGQVFCPSCGSDAHLTSCKYIVNAPEVITFHVANETDLFDGAGSFQDKLHDILLRENISLTGFSTEKEPLNYQLTSICVYAANLVGTRAGHIYSVVRARDGNW